MKVEHAHKLKREKSEKDFLREAMIALTEDKNTPIDVLNSKFDKVINIEREYLIVTADVDINYTCSVGYDRTEEYYEEVRDYEKERKFNNGVKYYKNVKKTRKVTDWSPYSANRQSSETTMVGNGDDDFRNFYDIVTCVKTCQEESFIDLEDKCFEILPSSLNQAEEHCKSLCFAGASIPGDHHKDADYSGTTEVKKVSGVILPEYKVKYTYNGIPYEYENFACGKTKGEYICPNDSKDVRETCKKKTKPFIFAGIGVLVVGFIFNILGLLGLAFLLYFLGAGVFIAKYVVSKKIENKLYTSRQEEKNALLKKVLEQNGLDSIE